MFSWMDLFSGFYVKIHEVSCFHFCSHFYFSFKKKQQAKTLLILGSTSENEIATYCQLCEDKIWSFYPHPATLSGKFFQEARKLLVQYIPIVKYDSRVPVPMQCGEASS